MSIISNDSTNYKLIGGVRRFFAMGCGLFDNSRIATSSGRA